MGVIVKKFKIFNLIIFKNEVYLNVGFVYKLFFV